MSITRYVDDANSQFSGNLFTQKTNVTCSPTNNIQKGGNWTYLRFNHSTAPSYGYAKAGAPISHELKANIYPALSENNSYKQCGGKKISKKKKRKITKKRKKTNDNKKVKKMKTKKRKITKKQKKLKTHAKLKKQKKLKKSKRRRKQSRKNN